MNAASDFRAVLEAAGLRPDEIVDGQLTRCETSDKPKSKNGAYVFHADAPASGWWQNWRTGEAQTWTASNGAQLTAEDRRTLAQRIERDKAARLEEQAARHSEARDKAALIWEAAKAAQDDHPYLIRKGVPALGDIRQAKDGRLIIPVLDERRNIQSLQFIDKNGEKRFLTGGQMSGGYCALHATKENQPIYICEGYATSATIHEATAATVIIAFNCGNLLAVAKQTRTKNPDSIIVICGDDDRDTPGNPGLSKATEAAKAVNGFLAVPLFTEPTNDKDFNDLATSEGLEAVRSCLEKRQEPKEKGTFDLGDYSVARFLNHAPPPVRWFFEDSMIQGTLGLFSAPGGSGKSFFCLQAAMGIASDLPSLDGLFQRGPGAYGKVFALFAEDSDDVLHHRFRSILRTFAPDSDDREAFSRQLEENLYIMSGAGMALNLIELDGNGNLKTSAIFDDILAMLSMIPDLKFVVLDPCSRLYSGNENDNTTMTYFSTLLERISKETGATVLLTHHCNKSSLNPSEKIESRISAASARGATALVNAARWALAMTTMTESEAKKIGGKDGQYVAAQVCKQNYGESKGIFYMERGDGGVLRKFESTTSDADINAEAAIVEKIVVYISEREERGEPKITARTLARGMASTWRDEIPGCSVEAILRAIDAATLSKRIQILTEKNERGRWTEYLKIDKQNTAHTQRTTPHTARQRTKKAMRLAVTTTRPIFHTAQSFMRYRPCAVWEPYSQAHRTPHKICPYGAMPRPALSRPWGWLDEIPKKHWRLLRWMKPRSMSKCGTAPMRWRYEGHR